MSYAQSECGMHVPESIAVRLSISLLHPNSGLTMSILASCAA